MLTRTTRVWLGSVLWVVLVGAVVFRHDWGPPPHPMGILCFDRGTNRAPTPRSQLCTQTRGDGF